MASAVDVTTLSSGNISLQIIPQGMHILNLKITDKSGFVHDVLVGSDDAAKQITGRRFMHCLVGRYCNRLPTTPLPLPSSSTFSALPWPNPQTSLHGGPASSGWDQKPFLPLPNASIQLFSMSEIKAIDALGDGAGVWGYDSPDGEGGYKGAMRCEMGVLVLPGKEGVVGEVVLVYRAKLMSGDEGVVNLTHHWGFNLDASLAAKDGPTPAPVTIHDHSLHIKASKNLTLDPTTSLPIGTLHPVSGKYDFTTPAKVQSGIDDFWVFDKDVKSGDVVIKEGEDVLTELVGGGGEGVKAVLTSVKSPLTLEFSTNQSGMQAWTGTGGYNGSDARKVAHGGKDEVDVGDGYQESCAVALEFHEIYGAWLHPELKEIGWDTVIHKDEIYNNWVKLTVKST